MSGLKEPACDWHVPLPCTKVPFAWFPEQSSPPPLPPKIAYSVSKKNKPCFESPWDLAIVCYESKPNSSHWAQAGKDYECCTAPGNTPWAPWLISSPRAGLGTLHPFWRPMLQIHEPWKCRLHPLRLTFPDKNFLCPLLPPSKKLSLQIYYTFLSPKKWKQKAYKSYLRHIFISLFTLTMSHCAPRELHVVSLKPPPFLGSLLGLICQDHGGNLHCRSGTPSTPVLGRCSLVSGVWSSAGRTSLLSHALPFHSHLCPESGFTPGVWKEWTGCVPHFVVFLQSFHHFARVSDHTGHTDTTSTKQQKVNYFLCQNLHQFLCVCVSWIRPTYNELWRMPGVDTWLNCNLFCAVA